ncbi:MAG: HNH endonuclease [Bacteroidales bacterium]|nr:HNH endonuclease [Bacteroidales bacterium]
MNWNDIFHYDNGVLYHKVKLCRRHDVNIGDVAGRVAANGYHYVVYKNKFYKRSRVVWEMFNGEIPDGFVIDHINHDTTFDEISNLECKSRRDNMVNVKLRSDSTSGITGISRNKNGKWRAYITIMGKQKCKTFTGFEDACSQRIEWFVLNGFHANHGGTFS